MLNETAKQSPEPLTDPATGRPLAPTFQPGYYPGWSTLSQQAYWDAATRKLVLERLQPPKRLQFFTPEEAATLHAVMDRIIPQEDRIPERRIPLLPELDQRLAINKIDGYRYEDMPSDQEAYRLAARAFETMAQELRGQPFHTLDIRDREEILKSVHDNEPLAAKDLWKGMNVERFWSMLLTDCSTSYYAHPWAWDEIGFGGPAYPRGYMRLENGEPEPWEVREQRYEWCAPADTVSDIEESHGSGREHQSTPGQGGTH